MRAGFRILPAKAVRSGWGWRPQVRLTVCLVERAWLVAGPIVVGRCCHLVREWGPQGQIPQDGLKMCLVDQARLVAGSIGAGRCCHSARAQRDLSPKGQVLQDRLTACLVAQVRLVADSIVAEHCCHLARWARLLHCQVLQSCWAVLAGSIAARRRCHPPHSRRRALVVRVAGQGVARRAA